MKLITALFFVLFVFCKPFEILHSQELPSSGGVLPARQPLNSKENLKSRPIKKPSAVPFFQGVKKDDLENRGIITAEMQYLKNVQKNTEEFDGKIPAVDQDLGGFSTRSKTLVIFCRDHGAEDNDRVTIYLNKNPIIINVFLQNRFQKFVIPLKKGVNTLSFKALNQGFSGPNTAQFMVFDENQKIICQQEWNLATGAKAFLSIARDE